MNNAFVKNSLTEISLLRKEIKKMMTTAVTESNGPANVMILWPVIKAPSQRIM